MPVCVPSDPATAAEEAALLLDTGVSDRKIAPLLDRADTMTRTLAGNRGYV